MRHMAALALGAIQERPYIAAGVCTFAMAFSLVAGNALYSQPGGHPVPLWATRDKITTRSVAPETPVRGESGNSNLESGFKALTLDRVPVPMMRPQSTPAPASGSSLLTQVQSGLARLGFYDGEIDGLFGPRTREAILAFQKREGLTQDGVATVALERRLAQASVPAPVARRSEPAREVSAAPVKAVEKAVLPATEAPRQVGDTQLAEEKPVYEPGIHEIRDAALIARVQIGLMNFGETGISVDGVLGSQTRTAISRFQERYGLAVTGTPDLAIVRKLEQIGALRNG